MANLEIEGKIVNILPEKSGTSARGPWKKQDILVEYPDGKFTAQVLFTFFGEDNVRELSAFKVGDEVRVSFNVRAREYNGKWFNDVRAWKIVSSAQASASHERHAAAAAPASSTVPPAPPVPPAPSSEADGNDDMPF